MSAIVEIKINKPICVETFQNYRELGRFMLRYKDTTIAAGLINEVSSYYLPEYAVVQLSLKKILTINHQMSFSS